MATPSEDYLPVLKISKDSTDIEIAGKTYSLDDLSGKVARDLAQSKSIPYEVHYNKENIFKDPVEVHLPNQGVIFYFHPIYLTLQGICCRDMSKVKIVGADKTLHCARQGTTASHFDVAKTILEKESAIPEPVPGTHYYHLSKEPVWFVFKRDPRYDPQKNASSIQAGQPTSARSLGSRVGSAFPPAGRGKNTGQATAPVWRPVPRKRAAEPDSAAHTPTGSDGPAPLAAPAAPAAAPPAAAPPAAAPPAAAPSSGGVLLELLPTAPASRKPRLSSPHEEISLAAGGVPHRDQKSVDPIVAPAAGGSREKSGPASDRKSTALHGTGNKNTRRSTSKRVPILKYQLSEVIVWRKKPGSTPGKPMSIAYFILCASGQGPHADRYLHRVTYDVEEGKVTKSPKNQPGDYFSCQEVQAVTRILGKSYEQDIRRTSKGDPSVPGSQEQLIEYQYHDYGLTLQAKPSSKIESIVLHTCLPGSKAFQKFNRCLFFIQLPPENGKPSTISFSSRESDVEEVATLDKGAQIPMAESEGESVKVYTRPGIRFEVLDGWIHRVILNDGRECRETPSMYSYSPPSFEPEFPTFLLSPSPGTNQSKEEVDR